VVKSALASTVRPTGPVMSPEGPLTIEVRNSRLASAESANCRLRDEFWRYCHTDSNSDRVGEFAIGTNIAVSNVIGNILQDEKIPGVRIAFGNPYGAHTWMSFASSTAWPALVGV
jgi:leucyl aminopeptidase (aminopeptidase T)